jgi:hypothetical protein
LDELIGRKDEEIVDVDDGSDENDADNERGNTCDDSEEIEEPWIPISVQTRSGRKVSEIISGGHVRLHSREMQ